MTITEDDIRKTKKWLVQIMNPGGSPVKWQVKGKLWTSTVNYKIVTDTGKEYYFPMAYTIITETHE